MQLRCPVCGLTARESVCECGYPVWTMFDFRVRMAVDRVGLIPFLRKVGEGFEKMEARGERVREGG